MAVPFDHTHDIDLEISRSKFEIALFHEWEGCLIWNRRDMSLSFMTMTVTFGLPWWGGWMYLIGTGITSDVDMPSTYRASVGYGNEWPSALRQQAILWAADG